MKDAIVLGAGMVGVCVAIHLQRRGRNVLLVDRRAPGQETSYGNAGIIQREAVRPRAFPRDLSTLLRFARNEGLDGRYDLSALPGYVSPLTQYWWHSAPKRYRQIVAEYEPLIANSVSEHATLIKAAGADALVDRKGWMVMFRTEEVRDKAFADADGDASRYGIGIAKLDAKAFAAAEPDLHVATAGALHWTQPWTVRDPGGLVAAYAELFRREGGAIATGDANSLREAASGWSVDIVAGPVTARDVVLALGPWAKHTTRALGYRLPLFVKRGYHREYALIRGASLSRPVLDIEMGFLMAPMRRGTRITTGAEFARHDSPMNVAQIEGSEAAARQIFKLGDRLDQDPWMGARPCTPDMKPIIGRAPSHSGLWFAFGHAHHGFTLGAVTGRLLAEMIVGESPFLNLRPFSPTRFGGASR